MSDNTKSRVDILKSRLTPFVKEGTSETSLKIPNRLLIGYRLDVVAIAIKDLLHEKYGKNLAVAGYEECGNNDHIFSYQPV